MRLAFVTEPLTRFGGAEKVLRVLHEMYPDAPIYAPYYDPVVVARFFPKAEVRTSFLQRLPWRMLGARMLLPLLAVAVESFDLRDFDLVVSSSSAFAKGAVTRSHARHVAYVHTPPRFLWEDRHLYLEALRMPLIIKWGIAPLLHWLRTWDQHTAYRVDGFFANSSYTAQRVKKYWGKDAQVLYPPVDTQSYAGDANSFPQKPYALAISRFTPHKRLGLALEAFHRLPALSLVIVGEGPQEGLLKNQAPPNAVFLPWQETENLRTLMAHAEFFVMPQVEDFGITAIESMAEGTPVLASRMPSSA